MCHGRLFIRALGLFSVAAHGAASEVLLSATSIVSPDISEN